MKISEIHFTDYQQFKNLTLNLTYPTGHPKAGQPLDKVCFIGQSGTGKTTILNVIKKFIKSQSDYIFNPTLNFEQSNTYALSLLGLAINEHERENIKLKLHFLDNTTHFIKFFKNGLENYESAGKNIFIGDGNNNQELLNNIRGILKNIPLFYIYLNAELLESISSFISFFDVVDSEFISVNLGEIKPDLFLSNDKMEDLKKETEKWKKKYFNFIQDSPLDIWKIILSEGHEYMKENVKYTKLMLKKMLNKDNEASEQLLKEFQEKTKNLPNPFEELAKKLNPFLNKFNLELTTTIDFADIDEIKFITLNNKQKTAEKFEYHLWSTGAKQIVMTATPLFALDTSQSIILFDEPERSLYPDLQKDLISFYTNLAPTAQFFFATHSPIIASQFDPWEIVELKFDEEYNIYQEDYIKEDEERHIDNYNFYPKYLRWDSILTQVYDMDTSGAELRHEALEELTQLEEDMKYYKEKNKTEEWNEAVKRHKELSFKLNWKR